MTFVEKIWKNGESGNTPITSDELNRMEEGISLAVNSINHDTFGSFSVASGVDNGDRYYEIYKEISSISDGSSSVVAEVFGNSGILTGLWFAIGDQGNGSAGDGIIVNIFIDDDTAPAVSVPVNDFLGRTDDSGSSSNEFIIGINSFGMGGYRKLFSPFSSYMRIELVSELSGQTAPIYSGGFYKLTEDIPDIRYKMQGNIYESAAKYQELTIADIDGAGQLESLTLTVRSAVENDFAFLEGNISVEIDGEPRIVSPGAEDFFLGAWYEIPIGGFPAGRSGNVGGGKSEISMYRFFPNEKITYNNSCVVKYNLGQVNQGNMLSDNYRVSSSCGFFSHNVTAADYARPDYSNTIAHFGQQDWKNASDQPDLSWSGNVASWPEADDESDFYKDVRSWIQISDTIENYWIECTVSLGTQAIFREAGIILKGGDSTYDDPYYGVACHVGIVMFTEGEYLVWARDSWETKCETVVPYGNLLNRKVVLAAKVVGNKITAYFRPEESSQWTPIGSWITSQPGSSAGIYTFQAAAKYENFKVIGLGE